MADSPNDEVLERALRDLAGALETGSASTRLTTDILERVAKEPVPSPSRWRTVAAGVGSRWRAGRRWAVGLLAALALTGIAVSPVGAEVADWFGFHGVRVTTGDDAPTGRPTVPPAEGRLTVEEAAAQVGFRPLVPEELGPPEAVTVTADRGLVSMSWPDPAGGTLRLDQFDAGLSPVFWKTSRQADSVRVGTEDGWWFPVAHEVVVLDESGGEVTAAPRLAARTLIWTNGGRTLRLEGELSRQRALSIARSVR